MALPAMQPTEINGVTLELRDQGSGEPVVFVHGAMGDELAAVLAEPTLADHYRLIDYHRRGFGGSVPLEAPLSIAKQSADCRAIMQQLEVERAHFVGQSYGGVVVLQIALDAPEAVHTLSLLEPALPSVMFSSPGFGALVGEVSPLYEAGDKSGAMNAFGRGICGADYRAVFDRNLPPAWLDRWAVDSDTIMLCDMPALQEWQFAQEDAASLTMPVLNLRGSSTVPYMQACYDRVRAWVPQAESRVVPNASHAMTQTNPKATAELLADFFAAHSMSA